MLSFALLPAVSHPEASMKKLAVAIAICGLSASQLQAADMSKDEAEIREIYKTVSTGFETRNAKLAMSRYAQEYVQFDIAPPLAAVGHAGNLKATEDYLNGTEGPLTV